MPWPTRGTRGGEAWRSSPPCANSEPFFVIQWGQISNLSPEGAAGSSSPFLGGRRKRSAHPPGGEERWAGEAGALFQSGPAGASWPVSSTPPGGSRFLFPGGYQLSRTPCTNWRGGRWASRRKLPTASPDGSGGSAWRSRGAWLQPAHGYPPVPHGIPFSLASASIIALASLALSTFPMSAGCPAGNGSSASSSARFSSDS